MCTAQAAEPGWVLVVPWDGLWSPGGVNQVVLNLRDQLSREREFRPILMVASWSALWPVERQGAGAPLTFFALRAPWSENGSLLSPLKWLALAPLLLTALMHLVVRRRVAVFNFHYPSLAAFPVALLRWLRLYRGALILSFHGSDLREAERSDRVARMLWKFVLGQATAVVATSRRFAQDVARFAGDGRCPVRTIHNGLDAEHFLRSADPGAPLPAGLAGRDFIVCVANWEHVKGVDVLLRAFHRLPQRSRGLALALIGRPGPVEADLRALSRELGLSDAVFFCGSVPHSHLGGFLRRARALCLPSRSESFGIVLLEAGAFALPVVASRVGGIPEIISDGESGLLVPAEDAEALSAALSRLLEDPELGRRLGDTLRKRVLDAFTWQRAYSEYRLLLGPSRPDGR
jgi:glycosyltransferase involved in cell wall biosynthesis